MKFVFAVFTLLYTTFSFATISQELQALEQASGGRLGVSIVDLNTKERINYRANERFPLCSTAKVMAVAAILKESTKNPDLMKQTIKFDQADLVSYSPITEKHLNDGMTVADLCLATLTTSDNTAMNLLMKIVNGPAGVTQFARSVSDFSFQLNRWEPDLNSAIPGDIRDTTTPGAMRKSIEKLILRKRLEKSQREMLKDWMVHNTTGQNRIRAAASKKWVVADKTGTGAYGTTNDVGILYPTDCRPIVVSVYFTQKSKNAVPNEEIIAKSVQISLKYLSKRDHCLMNAFD